MHKRIDNMNVQLHEYNDKHVMYVGM
jgi:hypothetical protein